MTTTDELPNLPNDFGVAEFLTWRAQRRAIQRRKAGPDRRRQLDLTEASRVELTELGLCDFVNDGYPYTPLRQRLPDVTADNALRMFALLADFCVEQSKSDGDSELEWSAEMIKGKLPLAEAGDLIVSYGLVQYVYGALSCLEAGGRNAFQAYWRATRAREIVKTIASQNQTGKKSMPSTKQGVQEEFQW